MDMRRSVAAVLAGAALFGATTYAQGADDRGREAEAAAQWERLQAELDLVLREADPAWALRPAATAWAQSGGLTGKVDAVLADWRSRRSRPESAPGAADAAAVAEPLHVMLQRIAAGLHRAQHKRQAQGTRPLPDDRLRAAIRDLRILVAKHGGVDGTSAPTVLAVAAASSSDNDACASATPIGNGTYFGTTQGATNDGSASCGVSTASPDAWFLYTATVAGPVSFDTSGRATTRSCRSTRAVPVPA
jgi:hypothetical protein